MPAKASSRWNSDPIHNYIRSHNVISIARINITGNSVSKVSVKMSSPSSKVVTSVFLMSG